MTTNSKDLPKETQVWIGRCLARQESLHTRLKFFNILGHRFRHGTSTEHRMTMHKMAVEAVCTIVNYDFEHGHPLFDAN